jgi:hypothetical protein
MFYLAPLTVVNLTFKQYDWFGDIHVEVDLCYQGIQSDYRGDQMDIPIQKPRKSKKNPNPQLSDEQKAINKTLSQVCILGSPGYHCVKASRYGTIPAKMVTHRMRLLV